MAILDPFSAWHCCSWWQPEFTTLVSKADMLNFDMSLKISMAHYVVIITGYQSSVSKRS